MRPLDRKLLRDLWRLKGQALAIALVIGCGVAVVIMSFGTRLSLLETREAFYERSRFADLFAHVKRAPEGLARQLETIDGVAQVETRIAARVTLDIPGMPEPASATALSLPDARRAALNAITLRSGRLPSPGSVVEAVASEAFAEVHGLRPGARLAAILNGRKRMLTIVGTALSPEFVYTLAPGQLMPDDRLYGVLWMPRDALAAAFDLEGAFNDVSFALRRDADAAAAIARVDALLERYGGVGAYERKDQASHSFLTSEIDQLELVGSVIPPIILVVAAFLLNIVLSRLVDTERELIGLLKACGYGNGAIARHYLKLALAVMLLGVALGAAFGTWAGFAVTDIYAQFYRFPFLYYRVDTGVLAIASLASLAAGAVGTISAVLRTASLQPAVAMAPPVPARYRVLALDRLWPFSALDQPSRMVLRQILRFPVRAGLTLAGIAASVALVVAALFSFDAIERIIQLSFFEAQRQDVVLTFETPRPARATEDIAHLPGVLAVEPLRILPVRLRHGHVTRRLSLTALPLDGHLMRLVDAAGRPVALPEEGLALTTALARRLQVGRGDRVRVEIMEGRRPVLDLPVSAVVEDYVGLGAYMSLAAASRAMGEAETISGASLALDRAAEPEFYRALKETPALAGVMLKRATVESFRATLAESMLKVVSFYVMFSGVIAFGVLYNSARIALSERGRDLASLRVLGLGAGTASYVLVAQLGLLTLAALPVGCAAGWGLAALISSFLETDMFRVPLVVEPRTYGFAMLAVVGAALASGAAVARRVARLDLIAVLKTRE